MAIESYNVAPYYDDYDPSKGFVQILAVAGKAEQSREFTQLGTMHRDFIARLGDAVFKDGTVIDGCAFVVTDGAVKISAGRLYFAGLVRIINEEVSVPIVGAGSEVIGIKLKTEIITENQDSSLRNPAVGTQAAGTAGAHRLKESLVFTNNDPDATTLIRLEDGAIVSERVYEETTTDVVTEVLARRTFDENGNFKIRGLALTEINESDSDHVYVGLTEGKAYIKGYEVIKPYQTKIKLPFSRETSHVQNEPKPFVVNTVEFKLNNYPVKQITRMVVDMQETIEMTRGAQKDGYDYLPHTSIIEIVNINSFTQGVDYQLSADRVDWSVPGGSEPASGSTYQITYKYKKTLVLDGPNQEVELGKGESNGQAYNYVKFKSGVPKPINNTQMVIDYDYYLARKDLILLDKNGDISYLRGIAAPKVTAQTPINSDSTMLVIGSVMLMPDSTEVYIVNQNTMRVTQAELYDLKRRIDELEVSLAITDLDREAMDGEDATDLKGIFTDGFVGLTKADVTNSEFDCAIDLDAKEMTLPFTTNIAELEVNEASSDTNVQRLGRVVTAPYVEEVAVQQQYATETMLVNPYAVYDPIVPIKLNPEVDNWIDTTKITVNKENVKNTTLRRWWYHRGESWAESEKAKWVALGFADGGESLAWDSGSGTITQSTSQVILDEAVMYMRSRQVTVEGFNFNPNEDNIKCTFNEIDVALTPFSIGESYGYKGTVANTMKANANGYFKATFTVPGNVPCGQVQVRCIGPVSSGDAVYRASGRRQIIEETVLTTKTVVQPTDPLAQSFGFAQDTVLTSIDLFFASKDPQHACVIQVRNMVNGYPGVECYTEEMLQPGDIQVSSDGTVATNVKFSQPVYCKADEQYCVAILTDSNIYQLWVAELGARDASSNQYVTKQPYADGVLFSSSNALTWTAHQTKDLKFRLYKAKFTGKGSIMFNNVTGVEMNRVVLAAQSVDYKNAGIEWWYRNNSSDSWKVIDTYVAQDLTAEENMFQLKCTLNVAYSTSPIVAADCINLVYFLEGNKATYVSRMIETEEAFTSIKVMLQMALPSGCTAKIYYKLEDVSSSWVELTSPVTSPVSSEWIQYQWTKTGVNAKKYRVKIELSTTSPLIRPRARKLINILKY